MWPYWLMFLMPATVAFAGRLNRRRLFGAAPPMWMNGSWFLVAVALALLIGLRVEVGGDWFNYFNYLEIAASEDLVTLLAREDPGYMLLNWLSFQLGAGVFGANLFGGLFFSIGLVVFCRRLPRPWLALAVAVPYTVIVVGMGYSRQGIALGFAMLGLVALARRSTLWFVVWVVLGATFHKSAVLLLPISALASSRNRYWTAMWVGVVAGVAYYVLLADAVDALVTNYIDAEYQSQGALIRLVMNALPAAILLAWPKRFWFSAGELQLWRWFAIISLVLLAILLATPASTAVDRVALYMLPLQMVVFSHLPDVIGTRGQRNAQVVFAVLLYYAAVQFVWLNFATHATYWLPYRFLPLEASF